MTGTVLYVDDDTANLVVLRATCQGEFDVITAASGPEGLEILKQREWRSCSWTSECPG